MKTRAEFFAFIAESLAVTAIIWIASVSFLMNKAEVSLPGVYWMLGITLAADMIWFLVLRRGTTVASLAVISVFLLAGGIAALIFLYKGGITFGYVMNSLLLSGISVYIPMYLCMKKQLLAKHMTFIDVIIGAFVWLMVFYTTISPDTFSILCIIAVTVMNIAAAIGLRMSEEGMEEGVGKAFALAAVSSAAAAGVIFLLVKLFSRSSSVTETVLQGIKTFFIELGRLFERFMAWLVSHFSAPEAEAVSDAAPAPGISMEEIDLQEFHIDPVIPAIVIGTLAVVIVILLIRKSARNKIAVSFESRNLKTGVRVRRKKGVFALKWQQLLKNIRFRMRALAERNTSPGVLVWLERKAVRKKIQRAEGESIREFTERLAPAGELGALAEDLERKLYGGLSYRLSPGECRTVKKEMRRLFRNQK